ncbi:MAG: SDR family NAD(P)-dependent oxidoreductase [Myxococcales bacterium]|nr:SDR family NAD(P)-dependent oxidoreductase [Myxococcales bacterium]
MNVAILGASKGMGRALARELIERDNDVFLWGRDLADLERSKQDLEARAKSHRGVGMGFCDLEKPETFAPALLEASASLGAIDAVVVTAGTFATQEQLESSPELCRRLLSTNFTHTILFCEAARKHLLVQGGGTLCVFTSVAGDRGRKPVILYGASKAGLSHYLEGLDHKFHSQGLTVINIKPGFVKTGMTQGLKAPPFAGEPHEVAKHVARVLAKPKPVVYTPPIWRWIMRVIRHLPRFVMRRLGF